MPLLLDINNNECKFNERYSWNSISTLATDFYSIKIYWDR